MQTHLSEYLPLAALILFLGFLAVLFWRGNYKIGAYIVQISAALFLSSAFGFGLYALSVVMVTTLIFRGSQEFLMFNAVVSQAIGATIGFAIIKRFGTSENLVSLKEVAISLILGIIGGYIGFNLFKDATFAADFVTNANSVAGAYFGAVIMGNSILIVGGLVNVLRNREP